MPAGVTDACIAPAQAAADQHAQLDFSIAADNAGRSG